MASVSGELPWPPSANHAWRPTTRGGKILSEEHRIYRKTVGAVVLEQRIPRHWTTDRLAVGMVLHPPNARTCDIDNRVKTTLDALVCAGVIVDDKFIDLIVIARGEPLAPDGAMLFHIEELSSVSERLPSVFDALVKSTRAPARGRTPAVRRYN